MGEIVEREPPNPGREARAHDRSLCRHQERHADGHRSFAPGSGTALAGDGSVPGFIDTDFAESITDPGVRAAIVARKQEFAISPDAIARAVAFAIEQPADVEIGSIVVRPPAQD